MADRKRPAQRLLFTWLIRIKRVWRRLPHDQYIQQADQLRSGLEKAFTDHPKSAGETYLEHLWFTMTMSARFAWISLAILIHGIFPFLCTRTASNQIEHVYRIIKTRIPKKRREDIDREYSQPVRIHQPEVSARIAIIGGGFSGALVLANMVNHASSPLVIDWFEPHAWGEGVAYGTKKEIHLLNVRAARMGGFADRPEHFYEWAISPAGQAVINTMLPGYIIAPDSYAPRCLYAEYIKAIIAEAMTQASSKGISIHQYSAEVVDAYAHDLEGQKIAIIFSAQGTTQELLADAAVLATGNLPPRSHGFASGMVTHAERYVDNIWDILPSVTFAAQIRALSTDSNIVVIGTGLTAVDTILALKQLGYKGVVTALSRSGLIPSTHNHGKAYYEWEWTHSPHYAPSTALGLLVRLRKEIRHAAAEGYTWQSVIDSLRPVTNTLWKQMELKEKRKFLARLMTLWNVHRHRMAAEISHQIRDLQNSGMLNVHAGKIYYIGSDNDGISVVYRKRGANRVETIRPAFVLNCTGPEYDIAKSDHSLLKRLRDREMISIGPLRAGIQITPEGRAAGKVCDMLYPIGSLMVGDLLECTAVPELRERAQDIAKDVCRVNGPMDRI